MAEDITILGGDVGVWWLSNNRAKMLTWEGTTGTYTMNELYSAMQTLQDESDTIDDGTCFNADTPTEYTIGTIDAGDNDPWYITFDLMQHITGGSLKTSGWTHATDATIGIVVVEGANVSIDPTDDRGEAVTGTDGVGTILELISGSRGDFLVIRPADSTSASEFTENGQTLTSGRGAYTFTQHATEDQNTGEMIWANAYSIGTVDPVMHMYVYQGEFDDEEGTATSPATDNSNRVYSVNSSTIDYWGEGHIDICVPINRWWRLASAGEFNAVDSGYLRVFARKGGDLYASFEVSNSTTSGGRNPVPLQTSVDLNQGTGTFTISFVGAATGTLLDGEIIEQTTGTNAGARGILDLENSTVTSGGFLSYFPIAEDGSGGLLTLMETGGETIEGQTSTESVTTDGAPAAAGPSLDSWFTNNAFPELKFGYTNVSAASIQDIDNNGSDENWAILVDCNSNPLGEVYEWLKYICSYTQGDTDDVEQALSDDISQDAVYGEEFEGGTAYFGYSGISGALAEGEAVTQQTTLATGIIVVHDTDADVVMLRNTRGTFNDSDTIDSDVDADTFTPDEAGNFAASVSSPFGTFAGGTFFGARGVLLENWIGGDANSFILTDIEGATRERPISIEVLVSNVWGNAQTNADADLVAVYPLTGASGDIDKDPGDAVYAMNCDGGESAGDATLAVDAIPVWAPASGRLVLIDDSTANNQEFVIRYSSYVAATDVYTLANTASACTTNTTATALHDSGASFETTAKRGDIVWSSDHAADWAYVVSVDSDILLTIGGGGTSDGITSLIDTDQYELNCLPIAVLSDDNAFNCIIHEYPTGATSSASIIYPESTFHFRVKVRNTREDDLSNGPIKPFSSDGQTSGTAQTIQTVRTIDTIIS